MFLFGRKGSPTAIAPKGRGPKMDWSLMLKRIKDFFGFKRKENKDNSFAKGNKSKTCQEEKFAKVKRTKMKHRIRKQCLKFFRDS